jgi:carboxyl-terminal processing protease
MINGTNTGKLFSQEIWNEKVMNSTAPEYFLNNFTNQILNIDSNGTILIDEPINSLSLQKVYFIISEATASASELIINGMRPYIDVRLVGTKTVGKQVGSVTLYDSDTFSRNGPNLNANHTYAIQPIVLEIKNANSENDPEGYIADDYLPENFGREDGIIDLGVLGFKTDPLLNTAITSIIAGFKSNKSKKFSFRDKPLMNSKSEALFSQEMYIEEIRN